MPYEKIDKRWGEYNKELDKIDISNIREAVRTSYLTRTISGEGNVATNEIRVLKQWNLNDLDIIEIGAGYGAYCEEMYKQAKVKSYTILDTKSMLRFAKAHLSDKGINCTFLDTEKPLPKGKWDLLIANICISEIPLVYAKELLTHFFKRTDRVAIIDTELPWLVDLLRENYDTCSKISCSECNQFNHYLYLGEKK